MNNSNETHDAEDVDLLYCRAALYSAAALGFRPPTAAHLERIAGAASSAALASAAAWLDGGGQGLAGTVEELARGASASAEALGASYLALFGHSARGSVSPYETEYGNEALFQQPQELGDLQGFYRAFGLAVRADQHERADHISCELEFMSFLAMKEAFARQHDDAEMLEESVKAQRLFLRDHLGRFLPAFARQISREDAAGFYARLAGFCLCLVRLDAERLAVRLGAANLPLRPAEDERVPMACGSGGECAAMPGAGAPEGADSL